MAFGWQDQQPYGNLPGILSQIGWDDPNKMDPRNLPQGLLAAAQSPDMPAMGSQEAGPAPMQAPPMPPPRPPDIGTPMPLQGAQPPTAEGQPGAPMPSEINNAARPGGTMSGIANGIDKFATALGGIYGQGLPGDKLIELGAALAHPHGWAVGLQEMQQNQQRNGAMKSAQQLQNIKLQREQAQLVGGAQLMKRAYPGMSEAEAQAAAANPGMIAEATKRLNPSEIYSTDTDPDGNIWQTNKMNGQRSLLKAADKAIMGSPDSVPYDSSGRPLGTNTGEPKIARETAQREAEARRMKLDPNDSRTKQFILTGNYPKDAELTSTDKNAILEADDLVSQNKAAIGLLKQAKQVSPRAYGNPVGNAVSGIGSVFGDQASKDTVDLHNIVTGQALASLKTIFGGNPTEGERKILLDLQGSGSLPDDVRQKIYNRAIEAAQRRLEFNDQRASQLRGGSFYKPNNAGPAPAAPAAPDPLGIR